MGLHLHSACLLTHPLQTPPLLFSLPVPSFFSVFLLLLLLNLINYMCIVTVCIRSISGFLEGPGRIQYPHLRPPSFFNISKWYACQHYHLVDWNVCRNRSIYPKDSPNLSKVSLRAVPYFCPDRIPVGYASGSQTGVWWPLGVCEPLSSHCSPPQPFFTLVQNERQSRFQSSLPFPSLLS